MAMIDADFVDKFHVKMIPFLKCDFVHMSQAGRAIFRKVIFFGLFFIKCTFYYYYYINNNTYINRL